MSPVRHQALTLVAPILAGKEAAVDGWLRERKRELQRALTRSTRTHFARWVVLPPSLDENGQAVGEHHLLAFESNFDGELEDYVAELRDRLGPLLDGSFGHVVGYPGCDDLSALVTFFRASSRRAAAYYVAHGGLSVPVIQGDAALRRAVDARLNELSRGARLERNSALELARDLQQVARQLAARDDLTLGWVDRGLGADAPSVWARAFSRPLRVVATFLLAPFFELRDEWARKRQPAFDTVALRAKRDLIGVEEDRVDQNGLTHLVALKPGWYRPFALRLMMYLVGAISDAGARTGRLGGIQTIHFARWVVLPDRRLLFFSNYDGSWEAYLGEFIEKAALGLTMIWTHTVWYPKTHFLLFQGAKDEAAFKAWTRAHQAPTQAWYSAYPGLSVGDILKNAEIRELLGSELSPAAAEKLLRLL